MGQEKNDEEVGAAGKAEIEQATSSSVVDNQQQQQQTPTKQQKQPSSKKTWLVVFAMLILIAIVVVAVAVPLLNNSDASSSSVEEEEQSSNTNTSSSGTGMDAPNQSSTDGDDEWAVDDMITTTDDKNNVDEDANGEEDVGDETDGGVAVVSDWIPLGSTIMGRAWKDRFGYSVDASSDAETIAIGAVSIDDALSFRQSQVFQLNDDAAAWVQLGQNLTGTDLSDDFGSILSLSGDGMRLVVGTFAALGYVRIYDYLDDAQWSLITELTGPESASCFGCSLDLSKDGATLVIGAPDSNSSSSSSLVNAGLVQVYKYDEDANVWSLADEFEGPAQDAKLGFAVATSADGSVIAMSSAVGSRTAKSYVEIVEQAASAGSYEAVGRLDGPELGDSFGNDLALDDGTTLAVAAFRTGYGLGQVYVYSRDTSSNSWLVDEPVLIGESTEGQFGYAIALSGDGNTLAAASNQHDGDGLGFATGKVDIFTRNSDGSTWSPAGPYLLGLAEGDEFGTSMALSEDGQRLVVGTKFGEDQHGERTGHVRVFEASFESQ